MTDILIVEDNAELGGLLEDFLRNGGYRCLCVPSGEKALKELEQNGPVRLVVLDIMLPGMDGFAVCRKIREGRDTPILLVSAKTEKEDKLNGLLLGADDYIEKPYDIDILLAKINRIFQRNGQGAPNGVLSCGVLRLDIASRRAWRGKEELSLSAKEYDLLLLLMKNSGKALKKEWIFNQIWGVDSFSEPSTLTVHVKWLRQKIEEDSKNPKYLLTVWGVGYRFEPEGI